MAATSSKTSIPQNRHLAEFAVGASMLLTAVPPPPEDLDKEGQRWWNYYCGLFVEGNMLSRMFITPLHNLCTLHVLRAAYKTEINKTGLTVLIVNQYGERITVNPLVKQLEDVLIKMDRLLCSLGMTVPTSKAQNINTTGEGPNLKDKPPAPFSPEMNLSDDYDIIPLPQLGAG